jgi:hypothetical protein
MQLAEMLINVDTVAMVSDRNQCFFHSAATRILINGSKSVGTR